MKSQPRKLAVFDIDGTLFRWQLFHELVTELTLSNVFPAMTYRLIDDAWQRWRGGELPFGEYEKLVIDTLSENLPNISVATLTAAAQKVVAQSGHKVHYFTHKLLKDLQAQGYYTLTISGSQQELLDAFATKYHFDDWMGVVYKQKDGHYTGSVSRATYGKKAELLTEWLVAHPEITLEGSVAVGDSDGDISLLAMVEQPIAFNPSEGLFKKAQQEAWPVVVERKNISYKFEDNHGQYVLAQTVVY
ncbi:HAD family phosphatase [Pedobacter sp.]|nr:HAD family phosphatase [Candidatus Saccharibacteria bacterium]